MNLLDRLFTSPSVVSNSAELRRQLAKELLFDDYFAIARIHDLNPVFWDCLIPTEISQQGTVVVFETRLGTVSSSLAKRFQHVISFHADTAAADITSAWLAASCISNVTVVAGNLFSYLESCALKISAIVIIGPDADPTKQWLGDSEAPLKLMLNVSRKYLRPDGLAIIMDNNRWAYKTTEGARLGYALPLLNFRLRKEFPAVELFVCAASLTTSHSPPPDFFRWEGAARGSNLPKNWLSKFKSYLLNRVFARLFWPSFLMILSKKTPPCMLQMLLNRLRGMPAMMWSNGESVDVKRLVAGNAGTTIVIAGPSSRDSADVVIRLPSNYKGERLSQINAQALTAVDATPLAPIVPKLLDQGVFDDRPFFVESRCPGFEVYSGTKGLAQMVQSACRDMSALHLHSRVRRVMTADEFGDYIDPFFSDIECYVAPEIGIRMQALKSELCKRMAGKAVSRGFLHGDFKLGNILFSKTGEFSALIDWDGFSSQGFQLFDYLTLLVYKMAYDEHRSMAHVYVQYLLPWKLPEYYTQLVEEAVSELTIDEDSFLCVRIAFWFALLHVRFDGVYKYHRRWHDEYMEPVLAEIELALGLRSASQSSEFAGLGSN
jgi:Phosphotransferase enzyme family